MPTVARTVIRVGTRSSRLATRQTGLVVVAIAARHPELKLELVQVTTRGDEDRSSPLSAMGVGVFVKALEEALAEERVDLVVHSLKDVPSELPSGFEIAAAMEREDPRDVLVNRWLVPLEALPDGARIGTGSPRRRAQLLAARPDLEVLPIRGNVETRLDKAFAGSTGDYDGAVLAAAGLARLERLEDASEFLNPDEFVPAVGQGALAVEIRAGDEQMRSLVATTGHLPTLVATTAERSFLAAMGGGCSVPISAHAIVESDTIRIVGFAADPDGKQVIRRRASGPRSEASDIARRLADEMLAAGARELLDGAGND